MDDEKITIEWNPYGNSKENMTVDEKKKEVRESLELLFGTLEGLMKFLPFDIAKKVTIDLIVNNIER